MKALLRNYLIHLGALFATSYLIAGLVITGGLRGLLTASLVFMLASFLLVPIIKLVLLPLNLLTLGFFAWLGNILTLYLLVNFLPFIRLEPFYFPGLSVNGVIIPAQDFTTLHTAILSSLVLGFIIHFLKWLVK